MDNHLRVLDLFSGIGGFSLGLERTGGFKTVAFCEIDPKARLVLRHHWPEVPIYNDVKEITKEQVGPVDVVCGGFPCQDISVAGKGAGLSGERSGLWYEMLRIVEDTRPKWLIAENVAVLRKRGLDKCLAGLAEIGYDAEWHVISASAVGLSHIRERVWIVAHPSGEGRGNVLSQEVFEHFKDSQQSSTSDPLGLSTGFNRYAVREYPEHLRVGDGVPGWVDRLRLCGNAVVPRIVELIGTTILLSDAHDLG